MSHPFRNRHNNMSASAQHKPLAFMKMGWGLDEPGTSKVSSLQEMPHTLSLLPITHYATPKTAFPEERWAHTYPFDVSAASITRVSTMPVTVDSTHGILRCICSLFNVLILAIVLHTHHGIF